MRQANVYLFHPPILAGILTETDEGYEFMYEPDYLVRPDATPVSLTLPLCNTPYQGTMLFPFFDGLIPEGWLLDIAEQSWKLRSNDRFGLLLACCRDCIGAVSIVPVHSKA
ncbi:phosphatidylinositol kinase [Rudanella paleaurantiibacter]|uniref:Phosphatidylinositol kinase n=1 Tax=Rudanella paleaurantiibacter TaxID=2614655 RepID=A0A7J5U3X0_9BACT|nr:HipA N-terminal domain-containing protein [Rudanella paleaurantiibacter]KAB7732534.1 phosphatidylinositol kinase [Rudanella paleaurantiibacter]